MKRTRVFTRRAQITAIIIIAILVGTEADELPPLPVNSVVSSDSDPGIVSITKLPDVGSLLSQIRENHPRIFINQDIFPRIRAWVEIIGYADLLKNADFFNENITNFHFSQFIRFTIDKEENSIF